MYPASDATASAGTCSRESRTSGVGSLRADLRPRMRNSICAITPEMVVGLGLAFPATACRLCRGSRRDGFRSAVTPSQPQPAADAPYPEVLWRIERGRARRGDPPAWEREAFPPAEP